MDIMESVKELAEKVGDTFERGAKKVSDSSKKIAEKSKVKREIASLESEINNAYYAIGKKYVELNSADPGEEYAETVDTIKVKTERIEKFKQLLASMEEKQLCAGCGAIVSKTQSFCDKCGTKIEPVQAPIIEGYNDQQPEPEEISDEAKEAETEAEDAPDEEKKPLEGEEVLLCPDCGVELKDGQKFCEKCGKEIEQ